eukprot:121571_1
MYYRHSEHYNYCILDKNYIFPSESGYHYNQKGKKYFLLAKLDEELFSNSDAKVALVRSNKHIMPKCPKSQKKDTPRFKYKQIATTTSKNTSTYSYGYSFVYGYDGEHVNREDFIHVKPKYASLKEELISGKCNMRILAFNQVHESATNMYNDTMRKQQYSNLPLECVLALIVYCDYDSIQYALGLSMRKNDGRDHTEFYHLAKYIKIAIHKHGTRVKDGNVKKFYHGIDKQLFFPSYVNNVCINCPLSTSSSYEVATTFCGSEGLIMMFEDDIGYNKYFDCQWLSAFSFEQECLFMSNTYPMKIVNIVQAPFGTQHDSILSGLMLVDQMIKYQICSCDEKLKHLTRQLMMIQLSYKFVEQQQWLNEYSLNIIETFFSNVATIELSLAAFTMKEQYSLFFDLFFKIIHGEEKVITMKMQYINSLFPNIAHMTLHQFPLSYFSVKTLCMEITSNIKSIQLIGTIKEDITVLLFKFQAIFGSNWNICFQKAHNQFEKCLYMHRKNCKIISTCSTHFDSKHAKLAGYFERDKIIMALINAVYHIKETSTAITNIDDDITHIISAFSNTNMQLLDLKAKNKSQFMSILNTCGNITEYESEQMWSLLMTEIDGENTVHLSKDKQVELFTKKTEIQDHTKFCHFNKMILDICNSESNKYDLITSEISQIQQTEDCDELDFDAMKDTETWNEMEKMKQQNLNKTKAIQNLYKKQGSNKQA